MKKVNLIYLLSVVLFGAMIMMGSCTKEGPAGPAGSNGTDGVDGTDGEDGINGTDGTTTCIECHDNSESLLTISSQWEVSVHATGHTFERNGTSCAPCHTSQGFLERMAAGAMETTEDILNPNPTNCYTCHMIHDTYTPADLAFTYADATDYWFNPNGDATPDFGSGNLCANCHQSRIADPFPTVGSGDTYTITSFRYGPHHGPQSQMLAGFSGYEIEGSYTYTNSPHTGIENSCVACHMAEDAGTPAYALGGHSFNVAYDGDLNQAGCVGCHPDGIEDETEAMQEEVHGMLEELHYKLIDMMIADSSGYLLGDDGENRASSDNPANLSANEAGAFFNFKFVEEDRSAGLHNYKYARALLTNSLEALGE